MANKQTVTGLKGGENDSPKKLLCTCTSEFQDITYGKGFRIHNPTSKVDGASKRLFRCVVCGAERSK